jgi:nucleoid-associated protein YgaU
MDKTSSPENPYMTELRSLMKDKFFMLLLGISVAIVLLSAGYSLIRPRPATPQAGQIANGEATASGLFEDSSAVAKTTATHQSQLAQKAPTNTAAAPSVETSPARAKRTTSEQVDGGIPGLEPLTDQQENEQTPNQQKSIFQRIGDLFRPNPSPTSTEPIDVDESMVEAIEKEASQDRPVVGQDYIVKDDDTLWVIAERAYGSGYNFVDIARANKLANPDMLYVGTKLTIPSVQPKKPTVGEITPRAAATKADVPQTYTVVKGDHLWSIAEKQLGDGYAWVTIAKLNNLRNPNIILPGQILKLK